MARLEEEFAELCDTRFAVACSSGTTVLHLALLAHGIGPGDEVITSPFTFIASVNSILYAGALPRFVDICTDTFNIDPTLIEAAITPHTKVYLIDKILSANPKIKGTEQQNVRHGSWQKAFRAANRHNVSSQERQRLRYFANEFWTSHGNGHDGYRRLERPEIRYPQRLRERDKRS